MPRYSPVGHDPGRRGDEGREESVKGFKGVRGERDGVVEGTLV